MFGMQSIYASLIAMKHNNIICICLLLVFSLLLCLGCTPSVQPADTEGTKTVEQPVEMVDNPAADGTIVSSAAPYEYTALEDYNIYKLANTLYFTKLYRYYIADNKLCVFIDDDAHGENILSYNTDGTLAEKRSVPNTDINIRDVRTLSDGTFLFLHTQQVDSPAEDFIDSFVLVSVFDADGQQLYQADLGLNGSYLKERTDGISYTKGFSTRLHINELEDGTRRILVNTGYTLYYLDECLNILNKVEVPEIYECPIYMQSDGIYLLGDTLPQMCTVDMNTGEITRVETMPVPENVLYDCEKFQYGADGKLYCQYNGGIYQCDGTGNIKEILRWSNGIFDGKGSFFVIDESTIFFVYGPSISTSTVAEAKIPSVLHTVSSDVVLDRRVIEIIHIEGIFTNTRIQEAVIAFNAQSKDYFVNYTVLTQDMKTGKSAMEQFNDHLLTVGTPDIVIYPLPNWAQECIDKELLLDLSGRFNDKLLGCLTDAFTTDDGGQYIMPLSFQADTFAAAMAVQSTPLTWDDFYAYAAEYDASASGDAPKEGALITDPQIVSQMFRLTLTDFYDTETMQCTFDSEEFRNRARVLNTDAPYIDEAYGTLDGGRYSVEGLSVINAAKTGEVRYLRVPFSTVEAYTACVRIFEDTPFTLCGLPTSDGANPGVIINSYQNLAVFADSDTLGGCKAFIEFVLSDDIQSSSALIDTYLPVTKSAMALALDAYRYLYYSAESYVGESTNLMTGETVLYISFGAEQHSAERDTEYASSPNFVEYAMSDEEREIILNFFETCTSYATADSTIYSIVVEELSAYYSGAKTLEEVTELIQSRVFIYLNE